MGGHDAILYLLCILGFSFCCAESKYRRRDYSDSHEAHGCSKELRQGFVSRDASSDIFTGGKPLPCAMIRGVIRAGRSAEVKKQLLSELWTMLQDATGLEDDKLLVSIQDNPANNAMEAGEILPEPQHEAEWLAGLGRTDP